MQTGRRISTISLKSSRESPTRTAIASLSAGSGSEHIETDMHIRPHAGTSLRGNPVVGPGSGLRRPAPTRGQLNRESVAACSRVNRRL